MLARPKYNLKDAPFEAPTKKSLWLGPDKDGITYSQLCRFLVCRERFRLYMVEGLREPDKFNHAMEYGSLWHEGEEVHAGGGDYRKGIKSYEAKLHARYPNDTKQIIKWSTLAQEQFPKYIEYYKHSATAVSNRKPVVEEVKFRYPYLLHDNRMLVLRGKVDCVYKTLGRNPILVIQENKTKGDIDVEGLQLSLKCNLQTMLYRTVIDQIIAGKDIADMPSTYFGTKEQQSEMVEVQKLLRGAKAKVEQTLYNVIRRPLSDRYAPKQKKNESEKEFYTRVGQLIGEKPKHFFMQWPVTILENRVKKFRKECLDPILQGLLDWWESIKKDPFDPWLFDPSEFIDDRKLWVPNPYHFQTPFGIYNSMAVGFRGDYFDYVLSGHKHTLQKVPNLYPELQ